MYNNDTTIIYQGGSGGFALYYYMLLSDKFRVDANKAQQLIAQQFPSDLQMTPSKWKETEIWPDNIKQAGSSKPQLFLICNPLFDPTRRHTNQSICNNTHKILLYTSIQLQLRLAWEKQAYWFTQVSRKQFNSPASEHHYIRQIINSAVSYNGTQVDPMVPQIIDIFKPNRIIRLESLFSAPALPDQTNFLEYWLSLQPQKAQHLLF